MSREEILTPQQYRRLKNASYGDMLAYLMNLYQRAYEDGLRDGETEFDDAVIVNIDEARERVGDEAVDRLLEENG